MTSWYSYKYLPSQPPHLKKICGKIINFNSDEILWMMTPLFTLLLEEWLKIIWIFPNKVITSHVTFRLHFKIYRFDSWIDEVMESKQSSGSKSAGSRLPWIYTFALLITSSDIQLGLWLHIFVCDHKHIIVRSWKKYVKHYLSFSIFLVNIFLVVLVYNKTKCTMDPRIYFLMKTNK